MSAPSIEQLLAWATQYHRAGDLQSAEGCYTELLRNEPEHAVALNLLGVIKATQGDLNAAMRLFGNATSSKPDYAEAHYNLGNVLQDMNRFHEAIPCYVQAISLRPRYARAFNNLGISRQSIRQYIDAMLAYDKALEIEPDYAEAHFNRATLLESQGSPDDAIAGYRAALRFNPGYADAQTNLGNVLQKIGQFDEAIALLSSVEPPTAISLNALANALKEVGRLDEALEYYSRAAEAGGTPWADSNRLYATHFHPEWDAVRIGREHKEWAAKFAPLLQPMKITLSNGESRSAPITPHVSVLERLKIGFISRDFREHPVGRFILPLVEKLDRERFEAFYFSYVRRSMADAMTARFEQVAAFFEEKWDKCTQLNDVALAGWATGQKIDVLIDLTMHMEGSRLQTFTYKPAPVQMTYLAYCSTTGVSAIDYRISDPYLDPVGMDESVYAEKTLRLASTYWCYRPPDDALPLAERRGGPVVFGCLNNYCKVSAPCWDAWVRILQTVPDSRLLIFCPEGSHRATAFDRLKKHGVDPSRLSMVARMSRTDYFRTYGLIDIMLDPFPYGGGTTTLDGLWMGVPVVSLVGQTAVGRGGASILHNLGRPEWLAGMVDDYVRIAGELANARISRSEIREQLRASSLMNEPLFARDFEAAIARAWHDQTGKSMGGSKAV